MDVFISLLIWFFGIFYMVVLFVLTALVWIITIPFDRERKIIHRILVWQSYVLVKILPIWKVRVEGREKVRKGDTYVLISNHQSILDILMIDSLRFRFKWVSKIENLSVPVLGWYIRMAGYLTVDRENDQSKEEVIEKAYSMLLRNISVMIFPEGTRSVDGNLGFFKRGAFRLSLEAGKPLLPIVIDGTGGLLPKHGFIFGRGHEIKIRIFDPVYPEAFGTEDPNILALKFSNFMKEKLEEIRKGSL
jgi:1-acyl-sn-glycerol-3-phosphate acyltransferase